MPSRTGSRRFLSSLLLASLLAVPCEAGAAEKGFPARVRLRHGDGAEESVIVSDFRFVYYSRRFIRHSTGYGKPADLEIQDRPKEIHTIQNEDLDKLRFEKLIQVQFEYREEASKRIAYLVATLKKKKKPPVVWPVGFLRNTSTSEPPIFRGVVDGKTVDFTPLRDHEGVESGHPLLVGFELEFPGMKPRRKRF